jgi:hypothetical protein
MMPAFTYVCDFASIEASIKRSHSLLAESRALLAKLDAMVVEVGRPWMVARPAVADRNAATLNANKAENGDVANARMVALIVAALSAAGFTCELGYLGAALH